MKRIPRKPHLLRSLKKEDDTKKEPQTLEECLTAENESLIAELEEVKQQLEQAEKEKTELTDTLQRHQRSLIISVAVL